ncbi:MAG: hypothetical protein U0T84_00085 [Chitinophagales bacterium]
MRLPALLSLHHPMEHLVAAAVVVVVVAVAERKLQLHTRTVRL